MPGQQTVRSSFLKRIVQVILAFGPGIFAIGYTIGTGSVTSMIVAGNRYGMQLFWVLFLSCLFSGILIYVFGKYHLVTGDTALHGFRKHIPFGRFLALFILIAVSFGQWNSLIGILGISSNIIYEILQLNFPFLEGYKYSIVLLIALMIMTLFYGIMLQGKYSLFEKLLIIFVSIMGISFCLSLFFVHPLTTDVLRGMIPSIPHVPGGKMMVAAFVGTTMAAATFLSRPLFIKGKGWTVADLAQQKNDAIVAATLVFIISGAIMAVAHGALGSTSKSITHVLDMAGTLEPVAGKFAVTIFFFGTLSAGLSSIFPCLLIAPLLLADYQSGTLDTNSKQFRLITLCGAIVAVLGTAFGGNPIQIQILTQVFNVFALPAVIIGMILIVHKRELFKHHTFNKGIIYSMYVAFLFSCIVSYNGVIGILEMMD